MSTGDVPIQVLPTANYDSDDSSSSQSLFNRQHISAVLPITKVTNDKHTSELNSLEVGFHTLQTLILEFSNQVHQLKLASNPTNHLFTSPSRPNSTQNYEPNDPIHTHITTSSSPPPIRAVQSGPTCISPPNQMKSFDYLATPKDVEHSCHYQDILSKTAAALERRDAEIHLLKKNLINFVLLDLYPVTIHLIYQQQHHYNIQIHLHLFQLILLINLHLLQYLRMHLLQHQQYHLPCL